MDSEAPTEKLHLRSVESIVSEARVRTGKQRDDTPLVTWLLEQEVETAQDFVNLSPESLEHMSSNAPGASMVLMDALRQLKQELSPGEEVETSNGSSELQPTQSLERIVAVEVHGHVGTITMNMHSKRNALSTMLCEEISNGIDRCCAAGVRVLIIRAKPGVTVWSAGHDVREFKRVDGSSGKKVSVEP